nr:polysaccharide pyruvyl transferase family protein [uncultured Sphingomonas sp.]
MTDVAAPQFEALPASAGRLSGTHNALKEAQQRAVLRFMSLDALLGKKLHTPGQAVQFGVDGASPLPLLRGLGWTVGFSRAHPESAADARMLYKLEEASSDQEGTGARIALQLGIERFDAAEQAVVESIFDTLPLGAILVLEVDIDRKRTVLGRQLGEAAAALEHVVSLPNATITAARPILNAYWIVVQKSEKPDRREGTKALKALARWRRLVTLGKVSRPVATAIDAGWRLIGQLRRPEVARFRAGNILRKRMHNKQSTQARGSGRPPIMHLGVHVAGNAGDVVLFEAVRSALDVPADMGWDLKNVRDPVDEALIARINRGSGLVIGGGGLFLVDNSTSAISGWQWPVPTPLLKQIEVPIAVFAVGYNRFRGQVEFPEVFVESLQLLVEKSGFVGIRNRGSMEALRGYLPQHLADKLVYQPCTTTVMSYLNMPRAARPPKRDGRPTFVLNAAFDRFGLRLKGREAPTLGGMAAMARRAADRGWRVILVGHVFDDEAVAPYLDQAGVPYEVRHFTGVSTAEILSFYESVDLVAGMRGHAQMIPFGMGTPIISLVAHDKMQWFLDDIGHSDWGVEFDSPDVRDRMVAAFDAAADNIDLRRQQVAAARETLWKITQTNLATIRKVFDY